MIRRRGVGTLSLDFCSCQGGSRSAMRGGTPPPPIVYVFFTDLAGNVGFKALGRSVLGIDGLRIF